MNMECPNCKRLEDKIKELEEYKKKQEEWRMKWQFRRGIILGILIMLLVINVVTLLLQFS